MEPDPYKTSASLIQAIKDQCDASSWERFYHIYHPLLFRYSCSLGLSQTDAEDLVGDRGQRLEIHRDVSIRPSEKQFQRLVVHHYQAKVHRLATVAKT